MPSIVCKHASNHVPDERHQRREYADVARLHAMRVSLGSIEHMIHEGPVGHVGSYRIGNDSGNAV